MMRPSPTANGPCHQRRDVMPRQRNFSGYCRGGERIVAEADVYGARIGAALDQVRDMLRHIAGERREIEFECDAGIEFHAVERARKMVRRSVEAEAVGAE